MEKLTPTDPTYVILGDDSLPLRYSVAGTKLLRKALGLKNVQELLRFDCLIENPVEHIGTVLFHGLNAEDQAVWPPEKIEEGIPLHRVAEYVLAAMSAITNASPEKLVAAAGEAKAPEGKVNGISSLSSGASPELILVSPTPNTGTAPSES
jgi:hypothetical protein